MIGTTQNIIFDRTRYTDKLREHGVDEKLARAHSDALDGALRDAVATKTDLAELESRINDRFSAMELKFADQNAKNEAAKLDILRWVIGTQLATAGLIIGLLLKFAK